MTEATVVFYAMQSDEKLQRCLELLEKVEGYAELKAYIKQLLEERKALPSLG